MRMGKVEVRLDPMVPATRCIASLTAAAYAALKRVDDPKPMVIQKALEGDGATYEVYFAAPDSDALASAKNELYGLIQRHLRHDGISLAVTGLAQVQPTSIPTISSLLEASDLFGSLPEDGRNSLAENFTEVHLVVGGAPDVGRRIAGCSAYPRVGRRRGHAGGKNMTPPFVYRMSPGSTLGAIGLVTGAPYAATAAAMTPVRAYRLDRAGISAAIAARAGHYRRSSKPWPDGVKPPCPPTPLPARTTSVSGRICCSRGSSTSSRNSPNLQLSRKPG